MEEDRSEQENVEEQTEPTENSSDNEVQESSEELNNEPENGSEESSEKSSENEETPKGTKIYVGNLPFSTGYEELKSLFEPYGEITDAIVMADKFSGRSKGFGFVTFANKEDAEKAISEMDGKEVGGRNIKVSEAKPFDPNRKPKRRFNRNRRRF